MRFALLFLLWPLLEITAFVVIGSRIGLAWTLLWVVGAGIAGMALIRGRGAQTLAGLAMGARDPSRRTRDTLASMVDGFSDLVAGLLLILPGFVSDIVALALLLPPVRGWLVRRLRAQQGTAGMGAGRRPPGAPGDIIEGEFVELEGPPAWRDPASVIATRPPNAEDAP